MTFSYQSFVVKAIILSGGSRGGARGGHPPLCFDQTEARKAEKIFFGDRTPPLSQGWMTAPPPSPPYLKVWIRH